MLHETAVEDSVTFVCEASREDAVRLGSRDTGLYASAEQVERTFERMNVWTWGQLCDDVYQRTGVRALFAQSPQEQGFHALRRPDVSPSIGPAAIPSVVHDFVVAVASSGVTVVVWQFA